MRGREYTCSSAVEWPSAAYGEMQASSLASKWLAANSDGGLGLSQAHGLGGFTRPGSSRGSRQQRDYCSLSTQAFLFKASTHELTVYALLNFASGPFGSRARGVLVIDADALVGGI